MIWSHLISKGVGVLEFMWINPVLNLWLTCWDEMDPAETDLFLQAALASFTSQGELPKSRSGLCSALTGSWQLVCGSTYECPPTASPTPPSFHMIVAWLLHCNLKPQSNSCGGSSGTTQDAVGFGWGGGFSPNASAKHWKLDVMLSAALIQAPSSSSMRPVGQRREVYILKSSLSWVICVFQPIFWFVPQCFHLHCYWMRGKKSPKSKVIV